ncbi:MBL fold metallo-hydrolase [Tellurirhabdus rosea]|uniref:MBL fold metallo-hydrolase n=1 Tax=Tellurirhabdus rosea TaxID=2674997 RepID=UPI002255666F|nr:MBL fold metallo-hydrolase [Tellurirhabdus rosea]
MRPLFITSLNSGSNGNCYYIGNEQDAVLVDAGISCRETERRMERLGLTMRKVRAIFISHEHSDHIRGVSRLAGKYHLPVYITPLTHQQTRWPEPSFPIRPLRAYEPVPVGELSVTAFPKRHDACDPHSFVVAYHSTKVGVFTDIGHPCQHVIDHFSQCHAAFLEANYDEEMLDRGRYPYFLKQRIRGGDGHLSNGQALALFQQHRPPYMSHVLLSHLSKDNNCPQRALDLFRPHSEGTEVVVASRFEESAVYRVGA